MSEVLTKIVHDCSTGVTAEIPLTSEEIAQRTADAVAFAEQEAARVAAEESAAATKEAAKAKLLALGLTEEEILAITR
jgi:hypothetical protein